MSVLRKRHQHVQDIIQHMLSLLRKGQSINDISVIVIFTTHVKYTVTKKKPSCIGSMCDG